MEIMKNTLPQILNVVMCLVQFIDDLFDAANMRGVVI